MGQRFNGFSIRLTGASVVGCVLLGACASSSTPRPASGAKLSAADFAPGPTDRVIRATPAEAAASQPDPLPAKATEASVFSVNGPIAASEGILDVVAKPGPPEAPASAGPQPATVGPSVLVDVKIGDVNGKPVYASKFLEPMGDHLRAEAEEYKKQGFVKLPGQPPMSWREAAREEINRSLNTFIEDELLRAEAMAGFTPEQKQGFFAFMQGLSDNMQSQNLGSRSAASQRLAQKNGMTMEDWLRAKEEENLVGFQLNQKIEKRINVTWRDIRQAYQKLQEQVDALPISFHRIEIKQDNEAGIAECTKDLAAPNANFVELAKKPYNTYNREKAGLDEIKVTGDPARFVYYGLPALNDAARAVKPGTFVGPIKRTGMVVWLYRNDRSQPAKYGEFELRLDKTMRGLHIDLREDRGLPPLEGDFQLLIDNGLHAIKITEEKQKYIERLKAKSTMTSVEEMSSRLLAIAEERYLPKKAN
jgi:hypothetical protein